MPSWIFQSGLLDGARDDWLGPWPPAGLTDAGGMPLSEERR